MNKIVFSLEQRMKGEKNADGRQEVFSPGNGAFCNRWQEAPNSSVWRHAGWNAKSALAGMEL